MSRYTSAVWKPIRDRSTSALRKDLCCWHTAVGPLWRIWPYFNDGAGGRGVYSHGMIGGIWGGDAERGLDGVAWQMQDTDLRAAANLDGNWHIIAWETADNGVRPIAPWTPKQCDRIVAIMVEAYVVDGIPLQLVPDSKPGRRGHCYHRQGCDPYRVAGGELWSSAYGKDCPTDPRIRQLPTLIERARAIVVGQPEEDDMTDEQMAEIKAYIDRSNRLYLTYAVAAITGTASNSVFAVKPELRDRLADADDDEAIDELRAELVQVQATVDKLLPTPEPTPQVPA